MKKLFLLIAVLATGFSGLTYAFSGVNYGSALKIANEYIENSSFDENWKNNNPKIIEKGRNFYTDTENISYIEFKVSCDTTPDCGFIMINFDGDDVSIPIASTSGNTPSEILIVQNGGNAENNKLYYFGPFEQYGENILTGDVSSIDPRDYLKNIPNNEAKVKEHKMKLKDRLIFAKKESRNFKKSEEFNELKKNIFFTVEDTETLSASGYVVPSASNVFIPGGINSETCNGATPCYNQFRRNYTGTYGINCASGCAPTAVAIIFGYYDRQGTFPNFVSGTAGLVNDYLINSMVDTLRGFMGTTCNSNYEGSTFKANIPEAVRYARDRGYEETSSVYSGTQTGSVIFAKVKSEINAGRPLILLNDTHAMVAFGYNNTVANIVRLNMGWGGTNTITSTTGESYRYSDIDYDMNAMYYANMSKSRISSYVTFLIKR